MLPPERARRARPARRRRDQQPRRARAALAEQRGVQPRPARARPRRGALHPRARQREVPATEEVRRRRHLLALVVWMFAVLMWGSAVQGMAARGAVCAARRRGVLAHGAC